MRAKLNGPPGTGKTTFLIKIVETAVKSELYQPEKIAFLSFSRAAAEEARDRVSKIYGRGNKNFLWFRTLHSACCRLLMVPGKQIFNSAWERRFKEQSAIELSGSESTEDEVFTVAAIKTKWDVARSIYSYSLLTVTDWRQNYYRMASGYNVAITLKDLETFVQKYEAFKNPAFPTPEHPKLYDFNDMLREVYSLGICPKIDLLIVDEAQDLSPLMFKIVEMWGRKAGITVIAGDPYQAIYEFQGAAPSLMTEWEADLSVTLDQSFRCPSQVHSAARQIVGRMKSRYANDNFSPRQQGGFVKRVFSTPDVEEISGGSTFYLSRTNFEVAAVEEELREKGIPYAFSRGGRSPVITDYAAAIATIERLRGGERISYNQIDDLLEFIPQKEILRYGEKNRIRQLKGSLTDFGRQDKQISLDNLDVWGWTPEGIESLKTGKIYKKINKITDKQEKYIRRVIKKYGFGAIGKKPGLSIGTLHSVKGKEADTVIIESKLCKAVRKGFSNNPDPEHRLAYVGDTRARMGVYIKDEVYSSPGSYYPYPAGKLQDYPCKRSTIDRDKIIAEILGIKPGQQDDWDFDESDMPF